MPLPGSDSGSERPSPAATGRRPAVHTPSLALGGLASATFAVLHAALAAAGSPGPVFVVVTEFSWAGGPFLEPGNWVWAVTTPAAAAAAALAFAVFALYAFAGSGLLARRPPALRAGLWLATAVYLLLGLVGFAAFHWVSYKTLSWGSAESFAAATILASTGLLHLVGTIAAGRRATP